MVPKEGFEPTHLLKVLRPERSASTISPLRLLYLFNVRIWWAVEDLNLGPLACEASALTTELTAQTFILSFKDNRENTLVWQRQGSNL